MGRNKWEEGDRRERWGGRQVEKARVGKAPTSPGCCSRDAGCLPGSGRAQRALRPPRGSFWGSAPLSAPMLPQSPAQKGGVWPQATGKRRPLPSQGISAHPSPHQALQLLEGESEEVDLDDAAKDTPQRPAHHGRACRLQQWGAGCRGSGQGQGSPVEEAGVDAVAGLQVLIDVVGQLDHPGKALRPWLQGGPIRTDLLACAHLPPTLLGPCPPLAEPAHVASWWSGACRTIRGCLSAKDAVEPEDGWGRGRMGKGVWYCRVGHGLVAWSDQE